MLTILASFAQEESRSVSENCKWRIRKGFEQGELINLRFIYGYTIIKGKIEIEESEAEIVRMIFKDYIEGMGGTSIAKKLREMEVKKLRGGTWNSERVIEVIKNEKYVGNSLLQKKYVKDHLTKTLVLNKGNLPKYYAEGTHLAIIELEIFQKAQKIMEKNIERYSGGNSIRKYPFTSKIVCGICGKKYRHKNKQGRITWGCSTYFKYGKDNCPSKQIPEDILISLSTEILEIKDFDEVIFKEKIKGIQVAEANVLIFVFQDGNIVKKEWSYKSRRESWSEEARQRAREISLNNMNGRS
jgi:hypothetical protein